MQERENGTAAPLNQEIGSAVQAALAVVTEGTVVRLAENGERLANLLDHLASPEMMALMAELRQSAPALTRTLRRLRELEASGALESVLDLAEVVHAARVSMGDAMVARLADGLRKAAELMDLLMASGIPERAPTLLNALISARDAAAQDKRSIGPFAMLTAPREPELQFVLKFLLAFARRLAKVLQGESTP